MEILAGFVFGFAGSLHCIGMCGPIVLAMPVGEKGWLGFILTRVTYHLGRVVTYMFMGLFVGMLGGRLFLPLLQQDFSVIAGGIIVLGAILPRLTKFSLSSLPLFGKATQHLQRLIGDLLREGSVPSLFALGMANGLLPCGFVYVAMTAAAVTANPVSGLFFMAGFGLGTVPAMVGFSLFPRFASVRVRTRVSAILPAFTVLVGVLLIVRGLNLGIPFISPKLSSGPGQQMMRPHN